jgi:hypothetical protein
MRHPFARVTRRGCGSRSGSQLRLWRDDRARFDVIHLVEALQILLMARPAGLQLALVNAVAVAENSARHLHAVHDLADGYLPWPAAKSGLGATVASGIGTLSYESIRT